MNEYTFWMTCYTFREGGFRHLVHPGIFWIKFKLFGSNQIGRMVKDRVFQTWV